MRAYQHAVQFRKELDGFADYANVVKLFEKRGWKVRLYSKGAPELSHMPKLQNIAKMSRAFTVYTDYDNTYTVMLRRGLRLREQATLLIHEAGHILCEHNLDDTSADEEREAYAFERWVKFVPVVKNIGAVLFVAVSAVLLIAVIHDTSRVWTNEPSSLLAPSSVSSPSRKDPTSDTKESNSVQFDNKVVITTGGEKYHTPDCYIVKDKTNIITVTIDEAVQLGKEPCKICNP